MRTCPAWKCLPGQDLAHHFFSRCLEADVVPYVVTKKTVFKWQVRPLARLEVRRVWGGSLISRHANPPPRMR